GGSLTDTLYFSLKQAQQPIIIKYDGSKIGLRGGDHRSNSFIHNLQPQKLSLYIRAEHDIQATCLTGPNGNGNEITLLYPVKAYGKEYVVVAPQSKYFTYTDNNNKIVQNYLYSQCCIVATENNTSITIESPVNLLGASERTLTATLQKGESYLIQARPSALDTAADLTGMRIVASAPIAVYSGGILGFGTHPTNKWFSINNTSESLLPISSYGQRYIVIDPVKSRNEDDLGSNYHKIVAMTDTATIYVNGNKISKLQKGESIVLPLNKYSLVYGTSPIAVIVLRRSSYSDIDYYHDEIPNTYGNPFMTDIAPQEYWQKSYDIFMDYQKEYDGMIFPDNYIDIIVPTSAINQITMNGKAVNKNLFKPLPSFPSSGFCSELSYATIMTRPSSLRLECNVPFGISCYGYGPLKSAYYAYGYVPGRSMNNASLSHPIVKTSVSDTTMCAGQSLQLQAYGGDGTFEWSPKEGLSCTDCPSPIATITKDILYTAVSKDYFGCPTMKQSVSVRVKTATVKASEDLGICAGDSIQLTVNEGLSYSWTPSNTLSCSDCRSPFARPTTQQTYYVTMTDKYGCVGIDSVTVSVGKPIADAGKDTIICAGSSVQIFASGGNYYRWEQSPDLSCSDCANPIISPKQSQYYRMRSFISANCYADDSVFITVEKATANIIASKLRYCKQDSIQLRVEGGKSVQWRGAGINCIDCREQKFIAPQSGYYYAEITTDNNCTAQDSVYITINTPQMTVSADTTICRGTSAKMWARGNGRFVWSPPQGLSCTDCDSPLASPTESTEYTVLLYDADNCIASEKVWVYVDSCVIQTQDTITLMASLDCETISAEKTYIHLSDNPLTVQSPIFIRGNTNAFFVEYSVPPGTELSRNDICTISITMIEKNQGTYSAEYSIGEGKSTKLNVFIQGKYEEKRANIRPHDTTDI
ncbi:MAG TPA: hypothetical protein PLQ21_01870, partial [Candidatus Kapabacteria bacterium]|nr:hypothetical protein [Candidatus Kapabacteria bacterium]